MTSPVKDTKDVSCGYIRSRGHYIQQEQCK